ncbi:M57 family metalloprotease [Janibacter sp. GS2]|uniref:M57 family metalloprotease n=1 Tax=Janibacter sp. GS2 TaxID=3442646 RepID=UPI003EBB5920
MSNRIKAWTSSLPSSYVAVNVASKDLWNARTQAKFVPANRGQTEKVYMTAYTVMTGTYDGLWTASGCNSSGHSVGTVNVMLNRKYTDSYSSSARKSVMVHELGHAIGLSHTGSSSCSGQPIMYAYSSRYFTCGHIAPQSDDISGANYLL